jgi:CDP-diacylglycerol--glycerol-3-phosphate 3-phosphatidyltransferase
MTANYFEFNNLPNRLTIFRILLIPFILGFLMLGEWPEFAGYKTLFGWIATLFFTVASITDYFDGHIARKRNIVTVFGSFLDPIADKFLVISSIIVLMHMDRIPVLIVLILILREVYMTSLRLLAQSEGISVPVSNLGKWKTGTQMTGLGMLMAHSEIYFISLDFLGTVCVYFASFLSAYSAFIYTVSSLNKLRQRKSEKIPR